MSELMRSPEVASKDLADEMVEPTMAGFGLNVERVQEVVEGGGGR